MLNRKQILIASLLCAVGSGCQASRTVVNQEQQTSPAPFQATVGSPVKDDEPANVTMVSFHDGVDVPTPQPPPGQSVVDESLILDQLVQQANSTSPRLIRLQQEYQAVAARSQYADKLPDPKVGFNVFGNPLQTAAGSQRANFNVSQTIPWLGKLNAEQKRICFEALAVWSEYEAERLRVKASIESGWYRLYVLDRQIEVTRANQELLKSLVDIANARVSTSQATQGDVLLGTVELSQLQERLLTLRRQRIATEAEINRLIGRPAETPIRSATQLQRQTIELSHDQVLQIATSEQPEMKAAHLRSHASHWGIEVARLSQRPEFMLSASYFLTDDNRPPSTVVDVGQDPWAIGAQVSIPLWHNKYDAMKREATWKYHAALSSTRELEDRYDAMILDAMAEANRSVETADLYSQTILPQARQALQSDQEAYTNGTVDFDRVIRDYRNLLTLELGYHVAAGDLAIANSRLEQIAGTPLSRKLGPSN